jgi:hypothetical protein
MLPEHTTNSPSLGNPIGMGKSAADDDNDGGDDEMRRFSKDGAWEESFEATLATTASPIGKRETPWRPVLGMHISRDIAHGWTAGL